MVECYKFLFYLLSKLFLNTRVCKSWWRFNSSKNAERVTILMVMGQAIVVANCHGKDVRFRIVTCKKERVSPCSSMFIHVDLASSLSQWENPLLEGIYEGIRMTMDSLLNRSMDGFRSNFPG